MSNLLRILAGRRSRLTLVTALGLALLVVAGVIGTAAPGGRTPIRLALVTGLSSSSPQSARAMADSVRMGVDEINASGGVRGRRLAVTVYDDGNDPAKARRIATKIVREDRVQAVIGHKTSDTTAAAAPIYAAAGIPAVTPSATAESITSDSDWYFRSIFCNQVQNAFLSAYLSHVLGARTASIVSGDDIYGRNLREGFVAAFPRVAADLTVSYRPGKLAASIQALMPKLRGETGPIVLALQEQAGIQAILALRAAGVTAPIVATDAISTDTVLRALRESDLNRRRPGVVFKDLYLVAPLINDSLTGAALKWAGAFNRRYGYAPNWQGATSDQALQLIRHALDRSLPRLADGAALRTGIRDGLAELTSPSRALPGLLGPMYFDEHRSLRHPIAVATTDGRRLISAPVQLALYEPTSDQDVKKEIAAGRVIEAHGTRLVRRQVVSVGISVNELRELDTREEKFFVDFFLWLKYTGSDAAANIAFANAVRPDLKPGKPVRTLKRGDATYLLYRVSAEFKVDLEFREFPFDEQRLPIVLHNFTLPSSRVVYVTDREILDRSDQQRLRSGADARADIDRISNWLATSVRYYQETVGTDVALGDPSVGTGLYYSQYAMEVSIRRDLGPFLVKNLLPLALLMVVTYLSFFLVPRELSSSVSIGVSAILSTAVLLESVTSQLPEVNYTVALEWGYYAFILLAVASVLTAIVRWRLDQEERPADVRRVTRAARVGYLVYVGAIILAYSAIFS